jgi:hypothetical protein
MTKLNLLSLKTIKAPMVENKEETNESRNNETQEEGGRAGTPDAAAQGTADDSHSNVGQSKTESGAYRGQAGTDQSQSAGNESGNESVSVAPAVAGSPDVLAPDSGRAAGNRDGSAPVPNRGGLLRGLNLSTPKAPTGSAPQQPATVDVPASAVSVSGPVDSLEALANSESTGLSSVMGADTASGYVDEIPASAPDRKVPPELVEQAKGFIDSLDSMYNKTIFSDPEFFGQMIRNIMMELQNNPQYLKLIADDDVAIMIRGMRESMGMARLKKIENKRGKGGTTKSKKAAGVAGEMLSGLEDLASSMGVSFDD